MRDVRPLNRDRSAREIRPSCRGSLLIAGVIAKLLAPVGKLIVLDAGGRQYLLWPALDPIRRIPGH